MEKQELETIEGMLVVRFKSDIHIITAPSGKRFQFTRTYSGNWKLYPISSTDMNVKQFNGDQGVLDMPQDMIKYLLEQ